MGKKKEPCIQDSVKTFTNIISRMGFHDIYQENRILCGKSTKNNTVLITTDLSLWNEILENPPENFKFESVNPEDKFTIGLTSIVNNASDWISVDCEKLQKGGYASIEIPSYDFTISINKDSIPVKLNKAEFTNIEYQISSLHVGQFDNKILMLRKTFPGVVDDSSFSIISLFIIM